MINLLVEDVFGLILITQDEVRRNQAVMTAGSDDRVHQGDQDSSFKDVVLSNKAHDRIELVEYHLFCEEVLVYASHEFRILPIEFHNFDLILQDVDDLL